MHPIKDTDVQDKAAHSAVEQRTFEEVLDGFPVRKRWAELVFARLRRTTTLPPDARVLDVGAASGSFVAACADLGYRCEGVEPWPEARVQAGRLAEHLGVPIVIVEGTAESIPYESEAFDVVHACSVIEHVVDLDRAFLEIHRVLKPGGIFWFSTTSALCPVQGEIRGFPLFAWYPDRLKHHIMEWARTTKPHLIGDTTMPAMHWFTPRKARSLLRKHGFSAVYDRWDLRGEDEGGATYRMVLRLIRSNLMTKTVADVFVPGCSYAAVKSPA